MSVVALDLHVPHFVPVLQVEVEEQAEIDGHAFELHLIVVARLPGEISDVIAEGAMGVAECYVPEVHRPHVGTTQLLSPPAAPPAGMAFGDEVWTAFLHQRLQLCRYLEVDDKVPKLPVGFGIPRPYAPDTFLLYVHHIVEDKVLVVGAGVTMSPEGRAVDHYLPHLQVLPLFTVAEAAKDVLIRLQ